MREGSIGLLRGKWRRAIAALLVFAMVVGVTPPQAFAKKSGANGTETSYVSGDYRVLYRETSTWGNYVSVDVFVSNEGATAAEDWELEFEWDAQIANLWEADVTDAGEGRLKVSGKPHNADIKAGGTAAFGFIAFGKDGKL